MTEQEQVFMLMLAKVQETCHSTKESHGTDGTDANDSAGNKAQSLYQVLGVEPGCSQGQIKKAYYMLSRKWHPDKNSQIDAEERFKEISQAYYTLSDESRRRRYDAGMGEDEETIDKSKMKEAIAVMLRFLFGAGEFDDIFGDPASLPAARSFLESEEVDASVLQEEEKTLCESLGGKLRRMLSRRVDGDLDAQGFERWAKEYARLMMESPGGMDLVKVVGLTYRHQARMFAKRRLGMDWMVVAGRDLAAGVGEAWSLLRGALDCMLAIKGVAENAEMLKLATEREAAENAQGEPDHDEGGDGGEGGGECKESKHDKERDRMADKREEEEGRHAEKDQCGRASKTGGGNSGADTGKAKEEKRRSAREEQGNASQASEEWQGRRECAEVEQGAGEANPGEEEDWVLLEQLSSQEMNEILVGSMCTAVNSVLRLLWRFGLLLIQGRVNRVVRAMIQVEAKHGTSWERSKREVALSEALLELGEHFKTAYQDADREYQAAAATAGAAAAAAAGGSSPRASAGGGPAGSGGDGSSRRPAPRPGVPIQLSVAGGKLAPDRESPAPP